MSDYKGIFLWYEIMTTDKEAALAFYSEVVGWKTSPMNEDADPYMLFSSGETPIAGCMTLPDEAKKAGAPPHWVSYVGVPDVDATAKQAVAIGGGVHLEPFDIPGVGRISIIHDPQHASIGLFTPESEPMEHTGKAELGEFSWNELMTSDPVAGWDFYETLFGWTKTSAMDMGEMGTYQMFTWGPEESQGGFMQKSADMPGPSCWLYYAKVDDVNSTLKRVEAMGGKLVNGPMEVPGGDLVAQVMDPQGAAFAIHSTPAA